MDDHLNPTPDDAANALVNMLGNQAARLVAQHGLPLGAVARGYLGAAIMLYMEAHPGLREGQAAADWLRGYADELESGDAQGHDGSPSH